MIELDLKNTLLKSSEFKKYSGKIGENLKKIHAKRQGFYKILDDNKTLKEILAFAKKYSKKYEHFVVLGIGGSALGLICINQTLKNSPKLFVLDNIDPILIAETEKKIDLKKTLFIVISKSGTNIEPLSQYFYFRKKIEQKSLAPKDHFVFITDSKKGLLREIAKKEKIVAFDIPENVGGRFSVLSGVGLLPASLIGVDIKKLLKGAKNIRKIFLNKNAEKNLCFKLALTQYLLAKKGKKINVMMPYAQNLIRFTDWHTQLLAESIGKKFNVGITPVEAVGASDQHSQMQLYNDGPKDKLVMFLEVKNMGKEIKVPNFPNLKNLSFNKLLKIEKDATAKSLTAHKCPNLTIKINKINEENLGELFMLFMGATAFLGELFGIDAFNQPGVELTKKLIHQKLSRL